MKEKLNSSLSDSEKAFLRERIIQSAQRANKKNKYVHLVFAVAASVVLLFGVGYFLQYNSLQYNSEPSLEEYVKAAPKVDPQGVDQVTLILGEGSKLNLDDENSKIQYSASGEDVNIGDKKTVNQQSLVNEKPIFNTLLVPYGKRTNLQLSDGTVVWLNSGSKLVFPAVFNGESRFVYLEGEAIFEVSHNPKKPFRVISGSQEIEVLGTVFNVTNYPGDEVVETVLKSGSINITYKDQDKKSFKLVPGTLASFNTKTSKVQMKEVDVDNYFSWRKGFLSLKKSSLAQIMNQLSRYYDTEILIEDKDLAAEAFSGNLELKEDVREIIEIIRKTTEFEVETIDNRIIITKPKK